MNPVDKAIAAQSYTVPLVRVTTVVIQPEAVRVRYWSSRREARPSWHDLRGCSLSADERRTVV